MRRRLTRKFVPIVLSMAMLVVAGCSSNTSDSGSGSAEGSSGFPIVKVFKSHMGIGSMPAADDPHVKYVAEKTGVQYELITTPPGSEPSEYLNLMIASDELPDILRPIGGVEQTLIQQGGALPLDELLPEYAPHVWESIPRKLGILFAQLLPTAKFIMYLKYSSFRNGHL